jgi:hypothetical protein
MNNTPDTAYEMAGRLSESVAGRLDAIITMHLPVWVKRWNRTLPKWALSAIMRWYGIEIQQHWPGTELEWRVYQNGRQIGRVVMCDDRRGHHLHM